MKTHQNILIVLCLFLASCSANWHLQKAIEKGALVNTDSSKTIAVDSTAFLAFKKSVKPKIIRVNIPADSTANINIQNLLDSLQTEAALTGYNYGYTDGLKKGEIKGKNGQASLIWQYQNDVLTIQAKCHQIDSLLTIYQDSTAYYRKIYQTIIQKQTQTNIKEPKQKWSWYHWLILALGLVLVIVITHKKV